MSFLDGVKGKISKASYSTVQKAKDISELTKLNMAISESETKIVELYSEIGMRIYDAYKENPILEAEEQIKQITELQEAIEVCKLQINVLNAGSTCPRCGAKTKPSMVYCSNCGLKLQVDNEEEKQNTEQVKPLFCSKCGAPLEADTAFCTECGNKVEDC